MPPTARALRRCYFRRIYVEGDVSVADDPEPEIYKIQPAPQAIGIIPINPHFKEPSSSKSSSDNETTKRKRKKDKRIRWDESGDRIRTYSPERRHSDDFTHKPTVVDPPTPPPAPIHKPVKKKTKKKSKSSSPARERWADRVDEDDRKRREKAVLEEQRRKRQADEERKVREEEMRRRRDEERRTENERQRREEEKKQEHEKRRRAEKKRRQKDEDIRRQQEQRWTQERDRQHKPQVMRRAKSMENLSKPRKTKVMQQPRWNYVGDPTRKAYVTREHSHISDFHF